MMKIAEHKISEKNKFYNFKSYKNTKIIILDIKLNISDYVYF